MVAVVTIAFIAVFTVAAGERHRPDVIPSGALPEWDRLILALQWPPTVCQTLQEDCSTSRVQNNWTIHGLWPNQGSSCKPVFCNNSSKFDPNKIKDLLVAMGKSWPSLNKTKKNEKFWEHEWKKHGTCATQLASLNTQHRYFAQTLTLSSEIDLYGILARANIRPSAYLNYPSSSIRSAFSRALGDGTFGIYCAEENATNILMEVRICYNLFLKLSSCKWMYGPQCDPKRRIKIPPTPEALVKMHVR